MTMAELKRFFKSCTAVFLTLVLTLPFQNCARPAEILLKRNMSDNVSMTQLKASSLAASTSSNSPIQPIKEPCSASQGWICMAEPLIPNDTTVGAWYTIYWYEKSELDHWAEWTRYKPTLGYYDSGNIITQQYPYFKRAGLDYLILDDTNGLGNDSGRINRNALRVFDNLPHDIPVAVVGGFPLWGDLARPLAERDSPASKTAAIKAEADAIMNQFAQRPNYLKWFDQETNTYKPLYVIYNDLQAPHPNDDILRNWADPRFTTRYAAGTADSSNPVMQQYTKNGIWGWAIRYPQIISNETIAVSPGYNRDHMGGGGAPIYKNNGESYMNQWLLVIKNKPKNIIIPSWNDWGEETAIEPGLRVTSTAEALTDSYGDEVDDWLLQITTAYTNLRKGLMPDTYYKTEDSPTVYKVEAGRLVAQTAMPHRKPVIRLPAGSLTPYINRDPASEPSAPAPTPAPSTPSTISEGLFKVGSGIYYSNGSHYCQFPNMAVFTQMTGKTNADGIRTYVSIPSAMVSDGSCQPAGSAPAPQPTPTPQPGGVVFTDSANPTILAASSVSGAPREGAILQKQLNGNASLKLTASVPDGAAYYRYKLIYPDSTQVGSAQSYLKGSVLDIQVSTGMRNVSVQLQFFDSSGAEKWRFNSAKFSVGDVFLVAGQSNAANHGEAPTQSQNSLNHVLDPQSGNWSALRDPLPLATSFNDGHNGSPWPTFADIVSDLIGNPVGMASTAYGGSSVSQWLNGDSAFINRLIMAANAVPGCNFKAVLWHQGETDAINGTTRDVYKNSMIQLRNKFIQATGCQQPWVVANASYIPASYNVSQAKMDAIRLAQQDLWSTAGFLKGPDTDTIIADRWDTLHFSSSGLKKHGTMWVASVKDLVGITKAIPEVQPSPAAPAPAPSVPAAPASISEGLFVVGAGIYYSNGSQHYCQFPTMAVFTQMTGKTSADGIRKYSSIPTSMISDGNCQPASSTPTPSPAPAPTPEPIPMPKPPAAQIIGFIDSVLGNTSVTISGWACEKSIAQSISVHVYLGGPAGSGTFIGGYSANQASEAGVASACGVSSGAYRFTITLPQSVAAQYAGKPVYIHGISTTGGANLTIDRSGQLVIPQQAAAATSVTTSNYSAPSSQPVAQQQPPISEGMFTVGPAIYYSNGSHYCYYPNMAVFTQLTGRTSGDGIRQFSSIPSSMVLDGNCGG